MIEAEEAFNIRLKRQGRLRFKSKGRREVPYFGFGLLDIATVRASHMVVGKTIPPQPYIYWGFFHPVKYGDSFPFEAIFINFILKAPQRETEFQGRDHIDKGLTHRLIWLHGHILSPQIPGEKQQADV
jgi:hypothetical protein